MANPCYANNPDPSSMGACESFIADGAMFTGQHYGRARRVNQGKVVSVCQKGSRKRIATDKALLGKNLIICGAYWRIERQHANQALAAKTQGNDTSE